MKIHQDIEEWMAGALTGALDGEEQAQFERHLAECAECRSLYREEQHMNTILEKQFTAKRPAPAFGERMVRQFRSQPDGSGSIWARSIPAGWPRPWLAGLALFLVLSVLMSVWFPAGSVSKIADRKPEERERQLAETHSATFAAKAPQGMLGVLPSAAAPAPIAAPFQTLEASARPSRVMKTEGALDKKAGALDSPEAGSEASTVAAAPAAAGPVPAPAEVGRKLIRDADVSYEVPDFGKAADRIAALAKEAQGYLATQDSDLGANGKREGEIVVKVPPPALDGFLVGLRALGDLKSQTLGTQDVTKDYFDTDARLRNARQEEGRLLEILEKRTGRLSDVLEVEREVARVRAEIEQMQGTLKYYDTMVSYATVTIALAEKDLNQTAQYLLREQADLSVFAADVEATLARAKAEAAAVNAQLVDSHLERDAEGRATATLALLIDPGQAEQAIAQMKGLGRIRNFQSHTERVAQDGSQPSATARTEKDKVTLNLTILQDQETSVQQTDVTLAATGVEAKIAELKKNAVAAGAEVKNASFQRDAAGGERGSVELRMAVKDYPKALAAVEALGEVKSLSVQRTETQAASESAPAEMSVRLFEPGQIVPPEHGLWATMRETLGRGFGAVMWSLSAIGVSMAFLAPWFLLAGLVFWTARRLFRRKK